MLTHSIHTGTLTGAAVLPACDTHQITTGSKCQAGIKVDADGSIYTLLYNGVWSQCGTWLLTGTNSDYTLVRTVISGTLLVDEGASTLLSSDAAFSITNFGPSGTTETTVITLDMTVTSGGAVEDSRQYTLKAELD